MPKFALFLRAVNVGGTGKLPMKALAETLTSAGFESVKTYVQSGNLIISTEHVDEREIAASVESIIESEFGFRPAVVPRSRNEIARVLETNPLLRPDMNLAHMIVVFLRDTPGADAIATLEPERFPGERFAIIGREMYIDYGDGMGHSKLTGSYYERRLGTAGTARNWKTVTKMLALFDE